MKNYSSFNMSRCRYSVLRVVYLHSSFHCRHRAVSVGGGHGANRGAVVLEKNSMEETMRIAV